MRWMRERLNQDEGFTLIELMVVVLIIAVLVAIAVPSFLGFRNRAQDRSTQADIRNVLLAEKAYWTDEAMFTTAEADLAVYEPSIDLTVLTVTTGNSGDQVCIEALSDSGTYFLLVENSVATGGTWYGSHTATGAAACTTTYTAAPTTGTWSTSGW